MRLTIARPWFWPCCEHISQAWHHMLQTGPCTHHVDHTLAREELPDSVGCNDQERVLRVQLLGDNFGLSKHSNPLRSCEHSKMQRRDGSHSAGDCGILYMLCLYVSNGTYLCLTLFA